MDSTESWLRAPANGPDGPTPPNPNTGAPVNHPPDLRRGRGVESNGQCNCHPGPTRQRGSEGQEVVECPTMMQQVTGHMGALHWRLPGGPSKMRWGGPCGRARSCWSNRSGKCSSCSVTNLAAAGLLALPASRNNAGVHYDATSTCETGAHRRRARGHRSKVHK